MGTIPLPIPWIDFHRGGHPPAFAYGQPQVCPFCGRERDDSAPDRDVPRRGDGSGSTPVESVGLPVPGVLTAAPQSAKDEA